MRALQSCRRPTKLDPADTSKTIDDNIITVIDLKASPIAAIAKVEVGLARPGIVQPGWQAGLVANRAGGTVWVLTVAGKTLTPAGTVDLGNPKSGPSHVAFLRDGKRALVTRDGDHRVSVLSIDGSKVEDTKQFMVGGFRPYSMEISSKGDVAVFGNQGGGQGDLDVINVVDLKQNPPRIVDTISVGQTPEGVSMSLDGEFVAITVMNGSQRPKDHQAYNDNGLVKMYRIDGTKLRLRHGGQGRRLGPGRSVEQRRQDHAVQAMLDQGAAGAELRRQGSAGDGRRQGSGRPGRHPHSRALKASRAHRSKDAVGLVLRTG